MSHKTQEGGRGDEGDGVVGGHRNHMVDIAVSHAFPAAAAAAAEPVDLEGDGGGVVTKQAPRAFPPSLLHTPSLLCVVARGLSEGKGILFCQGGLWPLAASLSSLDVVTLSSSSFSETSEPTYRVNGGGGGTASAERESGRVHLAGNSGYRLQPRFGLRVTAAASTSPCPSFRLFRVVCFAFAYLSLFKQSLFGQLGRLKTMESRCEI